MPAKKRKKRALRRAFLTKGTQKTAFKILILVVLVVGAVLLALPRIQGPTIGGYTLSFGGYNLPLTGDGNGRSLDFSRFHKDLSLGGGNRVFIKVEVSQIENPTERSETLLAVKDGLIRRLNILGVSDFSVSTTTRDEEHFVTFDFSHIINFEKIASVLGQTGELELKELKEESGEEWVLGDEESMTKVYNNPTVWQETEITEEDLFGISIVDIRPNEGDATLETAQIMFYFSPEGQEKFKEITKRNPEKPLGFFLDESFNPIAMPVITKEMSENIPGNPVVTGAFPVGFAQNLVAVLNSGGLPAHVRFSHQEEIPPAFGEDFAWRGLIAFGVGFSLVAVFMVFIFGWLGVVVDLILVFFVALVLALFKVLNMVLNLPVLLGGMLSLFLLLKAFVSVLYDNKFGISVGKPKRVSRALGFDNNFAVVRTNFLLIVGACFVLFVLPILVVSTDFVIGLGIGTLVGLFVFLVLGRAYVRNV